MNVTFQDQAASKLVMTKVFGYRPDKATWKHMSARRYAEQNDHPSCLQIVTWNIQFNTPYVSERTHTILRHIERDVFRCMGGQEPNACCIMLQEVNAEALQLILEDTWVKKHFVITPISPSKWPRPDLFGNVTLISRSVAVESASLLTFAYSHQGRGAVIVDVKVATPTAGRPKEKILRLINTHLESLDEGRMMRPVQLALCASLLRRKDEVAGGVVAGDMNALNILEHEYPGQVGLKDAWTLGIDNSAGDTWGHTQSTFPNGRFDKILYVDRKVYKIDCPKLIGGEVRTIMEDGEELDDLVSDHHGLISPLRVLR